MPHNPAVERTCAKSRAGRSLRRYASSRQGHLHDEENLEERSESTPSIRRNRLRTRTFRAAHALQHEFSRWTSGAIDVFALNEKIHEFHQGISRELYSRYTVMDAAFAVASSLRRGVITRAEMGEPAYLSVEGIVMSLASLQGHSNEPDA